MPVPSWYVALVALSLGLALGSFANVVVYRVPRSKSIFSPSRSYCPSCGTSIGWYDNIPLFSYIWLRGRCRSCAEPISWQYPIVELATGVLWVLLTLRFGLVTALPAFLALGTTLVVLSVIDFEHRRLPNKILGPSAVLALGLFVLSAALSDDWGRLLFGFMGSVVYGLPLFLIALAVPKGMGGGDIKLGAYLGLHLGWLGLAHVAVGAILGFFTGAVAGVALIAAGKKGRKDPIPFGPFMALGALIAVLFGDPIVRAWLG